MSSIPLISHHLFVAAAKTKRRAERFTRSRSKHGRIPGTGSTSAGSLLNWVGVPQLGSPGCGSCCVAKGAAVKERPRLLMETRSLQFITSACAGELAFGDPEAPVSGVSTDSRGVAAGEVFFALAGERFDAHDFLPEVVTRVSAVVVDQRRVPAQRPYGCGVIAVGDTRRALGLLAARYRRDFDLPMIAVGGSNGKTTTKELIASVLRQKLPTLWSEASFNNDVGVPLTLLRLRNTHRAAVLECGTNHPGELQPLVRMMAPAYGVITSIGREHLEFFGDLAGVAREEASIAEAHHHQKANCYTCRTRNGSNLCRSANSHLRRLRW